MPRKYVRRKELKPWVPPVWWPEAHKMIVEQNKSLQAIARELNVSSQYIYQVCNKVEAMTGETIPRRRRKPLEQRSCKYSECGKKFQPEYFRKDYCSSECLLEDRRAMNVHKDCKGREAYKQKAMGKTWLEIAENPDVVPVNSNAKTAGNTLAYITAYNWAKRYQMPWPPEMAALEEPVLVDDGQPARASDGRFITTGVMPARDENGKFVKRVVA